MISEGHANGRPLVFKIAFEHLEGGNIIASGQYLLTREEGLRSSAEAALDMQETLRIALQNMAL